MFLMTRVPIGSNMCRIFAAHNIHSVSHLPVSMVTDSRDKSISLELVGKLRKEMELGRSI